MPAAAVDKRQRIMQIREVMTVLFLAVMGWKDWKKKEISLLLTGTYGIIGLAFSIYAERPLEDWLLPFGVSLMILAVERYKTPITVISTSDITQAASIVKLPFLTFIAIILPDIQTVRKAPVEFLSCVLFCI